MTHDPNLTPSDVADQLQISTRKVYDLIDTGDLQATKLGHRTLRIKQSAVDAMLEAGQKTCS